ncbi:MAG TPA: hypothetical protein VMG34_14385 [Bacteroidota bacterium]|nr:hypothetical protein [Bacteroidota bacterium]
MSRKFLFLAAASFFILSGCGEKKADPARIEEVNKLIAAKNFDKGIPMIDGMAKDSPSDQAVKQAQISAHIQYANYFMYETSLPPHEKYPSALKEYRFVAQIDPTNAEAKQNIDLIEGIYNQMGRPVPQ